MSELPALLLEWTPPWVPLRVEDQPQDGDFDALCAEAHLHFLASHVSQPSAAVSARNSVGFPQLARFFGPQLGGALAVAVGIFSALHQVVPTMIPHAVYGQLWMGCVAAGLGILFLLIHVFRSLREQFLALNPGEDVRRLILRRNHSRASVKVKVWGIRLVFGSAVFETVGIGGYIWDLTRAPTQFAFETNPIPLQKFVSHLTPLGDGAASQASRRMFTLEFPDNMISVNDEWYCPELKNRLATTTGVIWEIELSDEHDRVSRRFQPSKSSWRGVDNDNKRVDGPEVYYTGFKYAQSLRWDKAPQDLMLQACFSEKDESILREASVKFRINLATRCPVPTDSNDLLSIAGVEKTPFNRTKE